MHMAKFDYSILMTLLHINSPFSDLQAGLDGHRVLFLDLDQVIVGTLAPLLAYRGPFAVLHTVPRCKHGMEPETSTANMG